MKRAIVGLYRHDARTKTSSLIERLELDQDLDSLLRKNGWKGEVEEMVRGKGFAVLALNVAQTADLDINIVVTVDRPPPMMGQQKKAVSRGGRPVDGPVKTGKTMAAKRRAAREMPKR